MINNIEITDRRFALSIGAGSDAIHKDPQYSYAVTNLSDGNGITAKGMIWFVRPPNSMQTE